MTTRLAYHAARSGSLRTLWIRHRPDVPQIVGLLKSHHPPRWVQHRCARSRTTVKASSLPQGALPLLPQDETEQEPEPGYGPLLEQHLGHMRKFPDCIVLTRVGDFYELYFEQVEQFAHLVGLKKAKRYTRRDNVPMAGFQHTQLDRYLKMFVQDLGKQVAISEQVPLVGGGRTKKKNDPMYDRRVTRVITAGTLIDESFMDPYENNHLLAVHLWDNAYPDAEASEFQNPGRKHHPSTKVGLSWADVSSGDFYTQISDLASLPSAVARVGPKEIVLDSSLETIARSQLTDLLGDRSYSLSFHRKSDELKGISDWTAMLGRPIPTERHDEFTPQEVAAGSLLLDYVLGRLQDTQIQLQAPVRYSDSENMAIDKQSLRSLELRNTLKDHNIQGSLLHGLRQTVTKGGARLLSQRLVAPSMTLSVINARLDLVGELLNHDALREDVVALLRRTFDTQRLLQKFSIGKGDADDLLSLAHTIGLMQQITDILYDHVVSVEERTTDSLRQDQYTFLWDILHRMDLKEPLKAAKNIQKAIDEEGLNRQHLMEQQEQAQAESMAEEVAVADAAGDKIPKLSRRGANAAMQKAGSGPEGRPEDIWVIRKDSSPTLSRAHGDLERLLEQKQALIATLRSELNADSLTLKWSAQLGYFCHIKGKDLRGDLATKGDIRMIGATKSTRSFFHADWAHLGVSIDAAKHNTRKEEEKVFAKLRAGILENLMRLRRNAAVLDELDVACSSANIAKQRGYVRPILNQGTSHRIFGGRHPTVDVGLGQQGRRFTANDCTVGDGERIYLITGPNMAGKSTYLRQNALITILAQTGSFVPADHAEVGLVDKVFSRVGSADDLYRDQSTFMVEMLETAEILAKATPRSFVIMDEVGRGTTPEDGVAVAYACLHHLHAVNRCRALFATHFHALADMTRGLDGVARYCTDVLEGPDGSWTYNHRLRKGVNRESHALKVARMAGMPESCVAVAAEVLDKLRGERRTDAPGDDKKAAAG